MSFSSLANRAVFTGNDATSVYAYSFPIISNSDLEVTLRTIATGAEVLLALTTDYAVTGAGNATGGNVTLVAGNLTSTHKIIIARKRPLTQATDIRNQGEFYPETHEDAFDHLVMIAQQLYTEIKKAIRLPSSLSSDDFNPLLPVDTPACALKIPRINAAGTGIELVEAADSVFMGTQTTFSVTDGQSAADLTGESVSGSVYSSAVYQYEIKRGTTVFSTGDFSIHYRNSVWYLIMGQERREDSAPAHGVTFSLTGTTTAQLQAALDSGAGNGTIKLKKHQFSS
jgi:hypothetical protein